MIPPRHTPESLDALSVLQRERITHDPGIAGGEEEHGFYLMGAWVHAGELAAFRMALHHGAEAEQLRLETERTVGKLMLNLLYYCVAKGVHMPEMMSDETLVDGFDKEFWAFQEHDLAFCISRAYSQLESAHFCRYRTNDLRSRVFNLTYALYLFSANYFGKSALDCLLNLKNTAERGPLSRPECTFSYCPNPEDCAKDCQFKAG